MLMSWQLFMLATPPNPAAYLTEPFAQLNLSVIYGSHHIDLSSLSCRRSFNISEMGGRILAHCGQKIKWYDIATFKPPRRVKWSMQPICTHKISLQSSKPSHAYPIIRLPREFSSLAGAKGTILQTLYNGSLYNGALSFSLWSTSTI